MRVGYLGLGDMGAPMAARLAAAGFALRVFDLLPARVEALLHTGAQAAAKGEWRPKASGRPTLVPV